MMQWILRKSSDHLVLMGSRQVQSDVTIQALSVDITGSLSDDPSI